MKELFRDVDELTGMVETFHFDPSNDSLVIQNTQDVKPILDEAKAFMADAESGWQGDQHRVASIPVSLLPELEKKGIMNRGGRILDQKKLKAFLNDRDNLWLRTRPGRV